MAAKKAVTSPSTPPKRRARNRANVATDTVSDAGVTRAENQAPAERPPSASQIIGVLSNPALRRGRAMNLADGEQADAYVVDFLPNFAVDHRADSTAARIPCGDVTGIGGIKEEIEARFLPKTGPGYFRITPRLGGKFTKGQWVEFVDVPPIIAPAAVDDDDDDDDDEGDEWDDELEAPTAVPLMTAEQFKLQLENVRLKERLSALERHLQQPQPQPTPQPQPKSLLEQLRELKEVKALLAEDEKPQAAPALTPELFILSKALEQPDKFGAFTERLMAKVLGNDEEEGADSWAKTLAPLVSQVTENLPSFLQMIAATTQAATQAPVATNGQPTLPHPASPPAHAQHTTTQPPATATTAALNGDPMAAYHALLTRLLMGLEQQMPTAGAELIERTPRASASYAGLVFPYLWPGEERARAVRLRRDQPDLARQADGSTKEKGQYLTPPGRDSLLYFPPDCVAEMLRTAHIPAVIAMGEMKALALSRFFAERGEARLVIGLAGAWKWREVVGKETNGNGESQPVQGVIPDIERIEWRKREVELVFDAEVKTNDSVTAARRELAKELSARGATVRMVNLPDGVDSVNGVDELLCVQGAEQTAKWFEQERARLAKRQVKTLAGNITFTVDEKGVYAVNVESGDAPTWVCSPLYIEADTRDEENNNWGRLLRFNDRDGYEHKWAMPMSMLGGERAAFLQALYAMGLNISPFDKARQYLTLYLNTQPDRKAKCVAKVGWHHGAYIFPDEAIGAPQGEEIYLQASTPNPLLQTAETLEEWQDTIGKFCRGNSRLVFSVSLAFAAPLLHGTEYESGGFHFKGESTEGKSTALYVAGSVWGGCSDNSDSGFLVNWNTTINSLEGIAEQHNDGLLCLDEIGQAKADDVGKTAYLLANGQGKVRMQRTINLNPVKRWRLLFLSSGEKTLADMIEDAGQKLKAGQEVRFITLRSKASDAYGLFEELHGFNSPKAFAEHLTSRAKHCYGTPIRAFISRLIGQESQLRSAARKFVDGFINMHVPTGAHAQVGCIATRFALVAYAGERATEFGITGWQAGEATRAAVKLFNEWLAGRGAQGSGEEEASLLREQRAAL